MTAEKSSNLFRKRYVPLLAAAVLAAGLVIPGSTGWGEPPQQPPGGLPDLVSGLKAVPGCLGVETARTSSGKNVIFAWFEDKKAVLRWYHSDMHQQVMKTSFPHRPPYHQPLQGVPDDAGPVLVIASLTFSDKPQFPGSPLPIAQISIELYKPLTGGIFIGSRFAPASLQLPGMRDFTPKEKNPPTK